MFGRLETDYTAPIVERSFQIMLRAGALAPIPEVLQGQGVRFEYQSPIRKLRQQVEAASARAWAEEMIILGQVKPEALDLVNVDALGRFTAEAAGLPNDIINGMDEVQRLREERAAAQQAAAEMQQLQAGVDTAATAADAVNKAGLIGAA